MQENKGIISRYFDFSGNNTSFGIELSAGITTFMTMAYILAVNPGMLGKTGMDVGSVFTATALSAMIATLVMGLYAKLPFSLAPGMGLNAFFTFGVVLGPMKETWQFALTAVFLEGIIFILLTFFNVREAIINSIPMALKKAISVGIGLFIAVIGFASAGIINNQGGTILSLSKLNQPGVMLALIGITIIAILLSLRVKGAILIGIVITTIIGIPMGVTKLPDSYISMPPSLAPTFMQFDFTSIFSFKMLAVLITFLMVDMFDTVGTLIGVATKANMLDENGRVPRAKKALFADAVGTTFGAMVGTSTVTTYVESASGVAEGGKTGFSAVVTAILFGLSLVLSPLFLIIPAAATAPALIIVGAFMMSPVKDINLDDYTELIPAFLTMLLMPLAYSISEGIAFGIISFVLLKVVSGKANDVPKLTYLIALIFILQKLFM